METAKDHNSFSKLFKRVAYDLFLLVGFYIPFGLVIMFASYNSGGVRKGPNWSLSTLGWKEGNYWMLIVYVVFVIYFFTYQINLFIRLSGRKQKLLNILKYVAVVLLLVGSCLPVDKNYEAGTNPVWTNSTSRFFDLMHGYLCQAGIGLFGVILIIMVVKFCIDTQNNRKEQRQITVLAYILAATLVFGLVQFWVAAFFEVWATFMAMCFASYITISYELAEKKTVNKNPELIGNV